MGCATSSNHKPSSREVKFEQKAQALFQRFSELAKEAAKLRNLLYSKFNIRNKVAPSAQINSNTTIGSQRGIRSGDKINNDPSKNNTENTPQVTPIKEADPSNNAINPPVLVQPNSQERAGSTIQIVQQEEGAGVSSPESLVQLQNFDDFLYVENDIEWTLFKETYQTYMLSHRNGSKITEMCRYFCEKMETQIEQLNDQWSEGEVLIKCLGAYKKEMKSKSSVALLRQINQVTVNSKKMLEQMKSTKNNLSQLSLMTIVANTSSSVVNCASQQIQK